MSAIASAALGGSLIALAWTLRRRGWRFAAFAVILWAAHRFIIAVALWYDAVIWDGGDTVSQWRRNVLDWSWIGYALAAVTVFAAVAALWKQEPADPECVTVLKVAERRVQEYIASNGS